MPKDMSPRTEIYVRFHTDDNKTGMYETPCATAKEAADLFIDDDDITSASLMAIGPEGQVESVIDMTGDVLDVLRVGIEEGKFETCPHPLVEEDYQKWWCSDPARVRAAYQDDKADAAYEERRLEELGF